MPSYSPVYSSQFILYSEDTPNTTFDVPEGYTAVIRQLSYAVQASETLFSVSIGDTLSAPPVAIDIRTVTGLLTTEHQQGHWAVPGGGVIYLYVETVGANATVYIGGYLLRNTLS